MSQSTSSPSPSPSPAPNSLSAASPSPSPSPSPPASATASREDAERIVGQYRGLQKEIQELSSKIGEFESDRNEHALVLKTLRTLPADRRAYRSVGGVLIERTVKEVIPAVENNLKGIEDILQQFVDRLKSKEKESDEFRTRHNLQVQMNSEDGVTQPKEKKADGQSGGVLVS